MVIFRGLEIKTDRNSVWLTTKYYCSSCKSEVCNHVSEVKEQDKNLHETLINNTIKSLELITLTR